MLVQIKRHDRRPAYQQIADELHQHITSGRYPAGAELPTLAELAQTYQVSDVTARNALRWLERYGIIAIRHGKRSVVLEPEIDSTDNYRHLHAQIAELTRRIDDLAARLADLTANHARKRSTTSHTRRSS